MTSQPIRHGGDLLRAIARFGHPAAEWLDLSTGVNPHGYPARMPPPAAWRDLPQEDPAFLQIAAEYFGCPATHILPIAGSQAVIRALPASLEMGGRGDAAVSDLTYGEYAPAFQRAGFRVHAFDARDPDPLASLPETVRHLVVVNPNNPTTDRQPSTRLRQWLDTLVVRDGTLIVDEAFADADFPDTRQSMAGAFGASDHSGTVERDRHLVVLKSVGKFFGLAGIRAGFLLSAPQTCARLNEALGAWTVSGPARHVTAQAFADRAWQTATRQTLHEQSALLLARLRRKGLPAQATPLFCWFPFAQAERLQDLLGQAAIWVRVFPPSRSSDGLASVRLGLPADAAQLARLDAALDVALSDISS